MFLEVIIIQRYFFVERFVLSRSALDRIGSSTVMKGTIPRESVSLRMYSTPHHMNMQQSQTDTFLRLISSITHDYK